MTPAEQSIREFATNLDGYISNMATPGLPPERLVRLLTTIKQAIADFEDPPPAVTWLHCECGAFVKSHEPDTYGLCENCGKLP